MALGTVCRLCCIRFCNAKCALHDRQNPQVLIQSAVVLHRPYTVAIAYQYLSNCHNDHNSLVRLTLLDVRQRKAKFYKRNHLNSHMQTIFKINTVFVQGA